MNHITREKAVLHSKNFVYKEVLIFSKEILQKLRQTTYLLE